MMNFILSEIEVLICILGLILMIALLGVHCLIRRYRHKEGINPKPKLKETDKIFNTVVDKSND